MRTAGGLQITHLLLWWGISAGEASVLATYQTPESYTDHGGM